MNMKTKDPLKKEKKPQFGVTAAYLYDSNGNFLGTCLDTFNCVVAACFKNDYIMKAKGLACEYDMEKVTQHMNRMIKYKDEFCQQYLPYIFLVPKNSKHIYVRENTRGKYNRYRVMQIHDLYNRLVLTDENKFIELHIIPKGTKLVVEKLSTSEMIDSCLKRVRVPVVKISGYDFPKNKVVGTETLDTGRKIYSSSSELSQKTGWIPSKLKAGELFEITKVKAAIKILEKDYPFKKNALYNQIMGNKKQK